MFNTSYFLFASSKNGKHYYYICSKQMHATLGHCPAKDLPADALENCIRDLMISFVSDDEFLEATYNQIKFNIQEKINKFDKDLKGL